MGGLRGIIFAICLGCLSGAPGDGWNGQAVGQICRIGEYGIQTAECDIPVGILAAGQISLTEKNDVRVTGQRSLAGEESGRNAERMAVKTADIPEGVDRDLWDELGIDEVDETVKELLPDEKLSFSDIVLSILKGETDSLGESVWKYVQGRIGYEIAQSRQNLVQLLFLAAIGAIFTQLAAGFGSAAVSDAGFHLTYLMIFGLLMSSFTLVYELAVSLIGSMVRLLQAALPVFFVAVAFSGKVTTSVVFSELATMVVTLVEWLNQNLLLPGVKLFLLLALANNLVPEGLFGKLSGLVKTGIEWGAKTAFGLVLGMNVIKGMYVPLQDSLSSGTMTRLLSALPGIGNTIDSAAGLVFGSVKLVKNGIGVAAMLCLVLMGLFPVLKLAVVTLLHYGVAALLEPIADARLTEAVSGAAQAMHLLLKLLLMACALFFLTIALICGVTG